MLNPCGEIPLSAPKVMEPEWQAMLMNTLRQKKRLPPYTKEEFDNIVKRLKDDNLPLLR